MPIHDWTRVTPGTWHDFHIGWIAEFHKVLNSGLLPNAYYAMAEPFGPVELTRQKPESILRVVAENEIDAYALKRRTIVIRHESADRVVALFEIISPGNKSSRQSTRSFVGKAVEAISRGYHLLVVDLFPPASGDALGIHGAMWSSFADGAFEPPPGNMLMLAAYSAGQTKRAYIEPTAVGRELTDMPLFLEPDMYVNVPLEATYQAAFRNVPRRWREVLEAPPP